MESFYESLWANTEHSWLYSSYAWKIERVRIPLADDWEVSLGSEVWYEYLVLQLIMRSVSLSVGVEQELS